MKLKLYVVIAFILISGSFSSAQNNQEYLVSINLKNNPDLNRLGKLSLPLLYEFKESLILSVTSKNLNLIKKYGYQYKILDVDPSHEEYYLLCEPNTGLNEIYYNKIFEEGDYLIVNNFEPSSKRITKYTKLNQNSFTFKNVKISPSKVSNSQIDTMVSSIIKDIDLISVKGYIQHLENYGTRFMAAPNRFDVSEWIFNKFQSFGFTDVKYDSFYATTYINYQNVFLDSTTLQRSVVATLEGTGDSEEVFIVCGHYDSYNSTADPFIYAPGATDNASGTAAVLEIAKVMMENNFNPERTIKFIALAAEELMNFGDGGSEYYAEQAYNSGMDIKMVINHDMISHTYQNLENSVVSINRHNNASHFSQLAIDCVNNFTVIGAVETDYAGADLGRFREWGFEGIYFEESEFSPYYHSSDDRIVNYSMPFCTEIIKASCATLIYSTYISEPVENITFTEQGNGTSLLVSWNKSNAFDFDHYNIYVGTQSGQYDYKLSKKDNSILVDGLISGTQYYFGISVEDIDGYEGYLMEKSYMPFTFSLDNGILIVDETADGNGTIMRPTDQQVDDFYSLLFKEFLSEDYDVISNEGITLAEFGNYSTIIWHGNDSKDLLTLGSVKEDLIRYLNAGGNFIYTGYLPSKAFDSNILYPKEYLKGDFIFDYLKINRVEKVFGARFIGSISEPTFYNNLSIDSTKTDEDYNYHIPLIESIYASNEANHIYYFDTHYDTSTVQGSMYMKPVGVEYIGEDFKVVTLSFPLYYMNYESAKELITKILVEKFNEVTLIENKNYDIARSFTLSQNFPNPFNPETKIKYSLPSQSYVTLKVFDVLGREVETLINKEQPQGYYRVEFDGSNLTSGVYFYRIQVCPASGAGEFVETKKMILMK